KSATVCLNAHVDQEACPHNLAATTSTTVALAVGDALAITLMKLRGFAADDFARNHPGGSIGQKLRALVRDLMHTPPDVGIASPDASMEEIVITASEKKLGGVLIVEGTRLLGLITDGDIRRALKHREK